MSRYTNVHIINCIIIGILISCVTTSKSAIITSSPPQVITKVDVSTIEELQLQSEQLYENLTIPQRLAQLMIISLNTLQSKATTLSTELQSSLQDIQPGGLILFGNNIVSTKQVKQLISDVQSTSEVPLFISVDVEGGSVNRFKNTDNEILANIPSAKYMSENYSPNEIYYYAYNIATELHNLGISMDFAPVADIRYEITPQFLKERIFGNETYQTVEYVTAFSLGLQHGNILSVIKHFPGHGAALGDTHLKPVVVNESYEQLMNNDIMVFNKAIQEGAHGVMLGHMKVPSIDELYIASMSKSTINILRDQLAFEGLIITDSLNMRAFKQEVSRLSAEGQSYVSTAMNAGVEVFLDPPDPLLLLQELQAAYDAKLISSQTVKNAVLKILFYKLLYNLSQINKV